MSAPAAPPPSPGAWPPPAYGAPGTSWPYPAAQPNPGGLAAAMVLTIVGAAFIVLGGFLQLSLALAYGTSGYYYFGYPGQFFLIFGVLGLVTGLLLVSCALLTHFYPQRHEVLGALIIGLAFASLFSYVGGFFLGFLLALIGGILTVTWRPTIPLLYYAPSAPIYRICPKCGRVLDMYARFCPLCGNPVT